MVIASVSWVPAGCANPNPQRYRLSPEELERLQKLGEEDVSDDDEDDEDGHGLEKLNPADFPADLRMDEYSDDDGDQNVGALLLHGDDIIYDDKEEDEEIESEQEKKDQSDSDNESDDDDDSLGDVPDTREYVQTDVPGLMDMHIGMTNGGNGDGLDDDNDDNSDIEDTNLQEGDCLILVGKAETDGEKDGFAALEVMLYNRKQGSLYVHHDIPLPAFPLAVAHGDINPLDGNAGNFCAVGTFDSGIEIWDLDVLDVLEPIKTLGGMDTRKEDELSIRNMARSAVGKRQLKQKLSSGSNLREGSHTDAVMSLSWNRIHKQVIASGSADCTVKLWDITSGKDTPASTFTYHKGKVQSVAWHPTEGTILATGSYDRNICLVDARSQNGAQKRQRIPADCEAIAWDPFREQNLTCASEDGTLCCWDVRKFDAGPIWSFVAHEYGVSDISYSTTVPGMMATCSVDQTVALWDAHNISEHSRHPKACGSKEMKVGKLYSVSFYPSEPWLLTTAGASNEISVWDMMRESMVRNAFADRVVGGSPVDAENAEDTKPEVDFEAMMASEKSDQDEKKNETNSKSKKKKGKKKVYKK